MAFDDVLFPPAVSFGAIGGPVRKTDVVTSATGHEERNQRWQHSRRSYDAAPGIRDAAQLAEVVAFFEERRGRWRGFRYCDPLDQSSNGAAGAPGSMDQGIGTGTGALRSFQLVKRYGTVFPYHRPIAKPQAGTVLVAVDGETLATGWSVDATTGIVTFETAPAPGAIVSAGFRFHVPVRFDTDQLAVAWTGRDTATVTSLPIIEVRI